MGGPIYEMEQPVTFELDYAARLEKVDEFIEWVGRSYGDRMWNFFKQNYDGILENKLVYPCGDFPSGMKLSKVLMKEFGLEAEDVYAQSCRTEEAKEVIKFWTAQWESFVATMKDMKYTTIC